MTYSPRYIFEFNNELNEKVEIFIDIKDGVAPPAPAETLTNITSCEIHCNSEDSELFDPVITRELTWSFLLTAGSTINFETFMDSVHDDYKCRMLVDGNPVFHGFLVPDEGSWPFQDYPIEVNFKATDGLKLLNNIALKKTDGNEFSGKHTFIEFIAACLYRTGLDLPIRVYCNIYNSPMKTRAADIANDMFQQSYFDCRTFMSSSTDFIDCYAALSLIFKDHFRVYYEGGRWVIFRIAEYQYLPEGNRYYTDYTSLGAVIGGGINSDNYAMVGKNNIVRAINENQLLSISYPLKKVTHSYNYEPWSELPRNNRFERGDFVSPPSTPPSRFYSIDNWTYAQFNDLFLLPLPSNVTTRTAYRESVFNAFNVEVNRQLRLEFEPGAILELQAEPIPVTAQDLIKIDFGVKFDMDFPLLDNYEALRVYIKTPSGDIWTMFDTGDWVLNTPVAGSYVRFFGTTLQFSKATKESKPIPADGDLYISFIVDGVNVGANYVYFNEFNVTYLPYVAGGYLQMKGDYWTRSQNKKISDSYDKEIQLSDTPKGALRGCILRRLTNGAFIPTLTEWYRYGLQGVEQRHFKELVNIGYYNLTYRGFYKLEGDFDATTYENNNNSMQYPIGFTPMYGLEDVPDLRLYAIVCPLKIDYVKGRFVCRFREVAGEAADGTQEADTKGFKYVFK